MSNDLSSNSCPDMVGVQASCMIRFFKRIDTFRFFMSDILVFKCYFKTHQQQYCEGQTKPVCVWAGGGVGWGWRRHFAASDVMSSTVFPLWFY